MSSIVLELQQNSLDPSTKTSDLLRKALVVAKKLGIVDFETWISHELNGYTDEKDIPNDRIFKGQIEAWNPCHGWQPVFFIEDPKFAEALSTCATFQPVGEIEAIVNTLSPKSRLTMPFSKETESQLIQGLGQPTQITRFIPSSRLVGVLDVVRNIVLNWSLKLEQDSILGEGLTFSTKEKEIAAQSVYHVNKFYGSATIQQGNISSTQITAQNDVAIGGDVAGRDKISSES